MRYYTYAYQVPLGPGDTLGFTAGKGYYAKPGDTAGAGIDDAKYAAAVGETGAAAQPPAGTASAAAPDTAIDWSAMLGEYGMPDQLVGELNRIFTTTGDLNQAIPIAQAYVRGTEWYAQTYPGIQQGINNGLFGDEQGYRSYQNVVDQLYQQYYGRPATPGEVAQYAKAGQNAAQVGNQFQSAAIQGNLSDPMRAWFTPDELKAYADQAAGIDSALGQRITAEADLAVNINSLYQDFFGRAVSRDELNSLWQGGTSPQDVAKQFATQANINAMNPAVSHLFSQQEIQEMALTRAGGITPNGLKLNDIADLARQLNSVYHVYTGNGVTRDEVMGAYNGGLTADEVRRQLEAGTISKSLPQYLKNIFGDADVGLVGKEIAGASSTAEGKRLRDLMQAAPQFNQVFQQYQNRAVTKDELGQLVDQGTTADIVARKFSGQAYADTNRNDIQYASGAFGQGPLSEAQLTALGQQEAGYDTPQGQQLFAAYQKALKRMDSVFRGVLASPSMSIQGGRLAGPRKPTDIGA